MIKKFLLLAFVFVALVAIFCGIHYAIVVQFNLSENPLIIPKIYLIIGLITLFIIQMGCFVKVKFPEYVGFAFMGGMIAKMAVVLALVVVNQEIKSNVSQLIISYFVILLAEVLIFIRLINLKLKKV
ncbi:hypothetical protein SAMN05421738_103209 [Algoriella xinjiangensis]|uniref:ATP synthase protein I n=1 Tax=Algoriella xinjiangensis TaxID=684065 RepID=A0A1I4UEC9_9FLAO|nr:MULTISPECIES: hypothetical protein [Algoriella]MBO6211598.1 hypothetical protein [Algoriella sp.]SFM87349.1 hypothetical protein SAMN05421738_103209 [Algoriella xinjiangensis]VDH18009.1 Uncharacterised protein [Algoriella xinjiangensis]